MPRKSFITSMAVIVALGLATQGFTQSGRSSRPDPSKNSPEITNEEWYAAVADWTGRKTIRFYGRNGSATGRADTKDSTIRFLRQGCGPGPCGGESTRRCGTRPLAGPKLGWDSRLRPYSIALSGRLLGRGDYPHGFSTIRTLRRRIIIPISLSAGCFPAKLPPTKLSRKVGKATQADAGRQCVPLH